MSSKHSTLTTKLIRNHCRHTTAPVQVDIKTGYIAATAKHNLPRRIHFSERHSRWHNFNRWLPMLTIISDDNGMMHIVLSGSVIYGSWPAMKMMGTVTQSVRSTTTTEIIVVDTVQPSTRILTFLSIFWIENEGCMFWNTGTRLQAYMEHNSEDQNLNNHCCENLNLTAD